MSFVSGGLRDLSISRTTFDWGVPVPGNDKHVMYVWVDALTNYITATDWPQGGARADFWPADLHVIGKDILRFHTVYWPAFLMSAGLPLPQRVFAHGFLFNKGEKMSKSVGNVLDLFAMAEEFGVDQMRFFFMREVPFGNDGSYSQRAIVERINADLANGLGNLAQRTLTHINKSCGGVVPERHALEPVDRELLDTGYGLLNEVAPLMNRQLIDRAIKVVWSAVTDADRYIAAQQPWVLKKTDPQRMQTVLWTMAEVIRNIVILAQPLMPASCARLLDQLAVPLEQRSFAALSAESELSPGTALPKPEGVFPRYVSPAGDA